MEKVWKLLHLQIRGRFFGYEIMSCLLIEQIFKVKQDSNLPTHYGNNVLQTKCVGPIEHFSLQLFGCEGQLDE